MTDGWDNEGTDDIGCGTTYLHPLHDLMQWLQVPHACMLSLGKIKVTVRLTAWVYSEDEMK